MKNFFSGLLLIILIAVTGISKLNAQSKSLSYADSLFQSKNYTEALHDYENIYQLGKASPSMLMKMAFIKEGLGEYAEALYYLNIYYRLTSDKDALDKMREIAEEHNLQGYEYSDFKFFLNTLRNYENEIIFSLVAVSVFLFAYIFRQKKKGEQPVTATFLQVIVVCLIAIFVNGLIYQQSAIISEDDTLLMTGPSAAAEPMDFIDKGHRVEVVDIDKIWSKIKWNGGQAYIRNKNIRVI